MDRSCANGQQIGSQDRSRGGRYPFLLIHVVLIFISSRPPCKGSNNAIIAML